MTKASPLIAIGLLSALALAITPMLAQAQSSRLVAKIPFGFHIGDQEFPAGEYTVSRPTNDNKVIQMSDGEGHTMLSVAIPATRSAEKVGKLIFNRYGDEYFLSEVRWRQSEAALEFRPSSREQEVAKETARQLIAIRDKRP